MPVLHEFTWQNSAWSKGIQIMLSTGMMSCKIQSNAQCILRLANDIDIIWIVYAIPVVPIYNTAEEIRCVFDDI